MAQPATRGGGRRGAAAGWLTSSTREDRFLGLRLRRAPSVGAIRRIIEIAVIDTLGLENSIVRSRTLISAATAATRLLEAGELEERLAALEAAIGVGRERPLDAVFDEAA